MTKYTRELAIGKRASKDGRSFPVTLASETPVWRSFGYEILDHSQGSVDLTRSPLPLIESHDSSRLNIGIVDNLRIENQKLKGEIRMGQSARADEIIKDIEDGIVRNVSIGYSIGKELEETTHKGEPAYRFAYQPYELSLVAAPADINTGINRSKVNTMDINETHEIEEDKMSRSERRMLAKKNQNIADVFAAGNEAARFGGVDVAREVIAKGGDVNDFSSELLRQMGKNSEIVRTDDPYDNSRRYGGRSDISKDYSITNLLRSLAFPGEKHDIGFEMEYHQDLQRQLGKKSKGILVPISALSTRAVTKSGTGSNLIATDHMDDQFVDVLRARSQVMRLGPTILSGLQGDVEIPRKNSGSQAYWIEGDDADAITESDISLGGITMSPKTVGGLVRFSHKMLVQSAPGIEQIIRGDLADMIASEIDLKAITGDGTGNTPTGLLSQNGISGATYANGGTPSFADIVGMETLLADDNADAGSLAYLTTAILAGALKTTDVGTDTGQHVWTAGSERGAGQMNGLPAFSSGNVPASTCILGNWIDLLIGTWGVIEIDADPYGSNFAKGSVSVRALMDVDFAIRHPQSFAVLTEAP